MPNRIGGLEPLLGAAVRKYELELELESRSGSRSGSSPRRREGSKAERAIDTWTSATCFASLLPHSLMPIPRRRQPSVDSGGQLIASKHRFGSEALQFEPVGRNNKVGGRSTVSHMKLMS